MGGPGLSGDADDVDGRGAIQRREFGHGCARLGDRRTDGAAVLMTILRAVVVGVPGRLEYHRRLSPEGEKGDQHQQSGVEPADGHENSKMASEG